MEQDMRTKLIEAATPLFAKRGFAAVSIRELAKAADVNVAAISYYFGGKEGLYTAVLEHQFAPIAEKQAWLAQNSPQSGEERLLLYAQAVPAVHGQRPFLIRFMHAEMINPTICFEAVVKKYITGLFLFLSRAIADGVAAGEFKPGINPGQAALSLAGILNFYFIAKPLAQSLLAGCSDQEFVEQSFRIYLDGIRRDDHA
ncbi:MAG TPA: TetR family transcriptional regulator [Selenomonadales bacterium]|nr:TetR family transcriptional regulator [Selenomonadales bacterium]